MQRTGVGRSSPTPNSGGEGAPGLGLGGGSKVKADSQHAGREGDSQLLLLLYPCGVSLPTPRGLCESVRRKEDRCCAAPLSTLALRSPPPPHPTPPSLCWKRSLRPALASLQRKLEHHPQREGDFLEGPNSPDFQKLVIQFLGYHVLIYPEEHVTSRSSLGLLPHRPQAPSTQWDRRISHSGALPVPVQPSSLSPLQRPQHTS